MNRPGSASRSKRAHSPSRAAERSEDEEYLRLARPLAAICRRHGAPFILNDRVRLVADADADGDTDADMDTDTDSDGDGDGGDDSGDTDKVCAVLSTAI